MHFFLFFWFFGFWGHMKNVWCVFSFKLYQNNQKQKCFIMPGCARTSHIAVPKDSRLMKDLCFLFFALTSKPKIFGFFGFFALTRRS